LSIEVCGHYEEHACCIGMKDLRDIALYPLLFKPIFQHRIWGGRRFQSLLSTALPDDPLIGEAWLLSDREDQASEVAEGPLQGLLIHQLIERSPTEMLGDLAGRFKRFPLLLKFLDVHESLSVQVHPSDKQALQFDDGAHGKTESWVVLEVQDTGRIYAGLATGTTEKQLAQAVTAGTLPQRLASFVPKVGDAVMVHGGTVHSLRQVVVFELQENSDTTYRLYDWEHTDPATGEPRPLQVNQALASVSFPQGPVEPWRLSGSEETELRDQILSCEHFEVWRIRSSGGYSVGSSSTPHVLVCTSGAGCVSHGDAKYPFGKGDVVLLPPALGVCTCIAEGAVVLDISVPDGASV
jgi:mannose-6-phosphate isomerase